MKISLRNYLLFMAGNSLSLVELSDVLSLLLNKQISTRACDISFYRAAGMIEAKKLKPEFIYLADQIRSNFNRFCEEGRSSYDKKERINSLIKKIQEENNLPDMLEI